MSFNIFDQFVFSLFTRLLEMSAKLQLNKKKKKPCDSLVAQLQLQLHILCHKLL